MKQKNRNTTAYYDHQHTITDEQGNVIHDDRTIKRKLPVEDSFIKLYYKRLLVTYIDPTDSFDSLIDLIIVMANDITPAETDEISGDTSEQMITINRVSRLKYAKHLHVSERRIYQMVNELIDAKILRRVTRGYYAVNPFIIGKGRWTDILKIREVWTANELGYEHEVTTEQKDASGNTKTSQITQKSGDQPRAKSIETSNYSQMDIFGNDHKIITDKHGHRDYAD